MAWRKSASKFRRCVQIFSKHLREFAIHETRPSHYFHSAEQCATRPHAPPSLSPCGLSPKGSSAFTSNKITRGWSRGAIKSIFFQNGIDPSFASQLPISISRFDHKCALRKLSHRNSQKSFSSCTACSKFRNRVSWNELGLEANLLPVISAQTHHARNSLAAENGQVPETKNVRFGIDSNTGMNFPRTLALAWIQSPSFVPVASLEHPLSSFHERHSICE